MLEIDPLGQELYQGTHLDDKQRIFIYLDYFILELSNSPTTTMFLSSVRNFTHLISLIKHNNTT